MMDIQDNGQSIDEKVTIPLAAKALKVSTKTVHRYIEKGLLTKVKEGTRVYVPMDEIRALLSGQPKIDKCPRVHEKDRVTVDRTHYDGLLVRLGQLEANQQLLLEYRAGIESRDKALEQAKGNINAQAQELAEARATITKARSELQQLLMVKQDAEAKGKALLDQRAALEAKERELAKIRAEVERLRLPFWKRIFKR
jgi:multidrug efflux pump subunit AcrA (membrane-fusion protein)